MWGMKSVSVKSIAYGGLIAVVALSTASVSHARDARSAPAASSSQSSQAPWYERFTFGSELRDGANAWVPRGESRTSAVVDARSRWGVTFGVNQEARAALAPRAGQSTARASAGVFYQVLPKIRVGGAVTLSDEQLGVSQRRDARKSREPGVKVESAIRF